MPKALREGRKIQLADGREIEIFPLTIRQLRKFIKAADGLDVAQDEMNDDTITKMVEAAAIALEKDHPEIAKDTDALEDLLDLKCFGQLFAAAMGNDPNG